MKHTAVYNKEVGYVCSACTGLVNEAGVYYKHKYRGFLPIYTCDVCGRIYFHFNLRNKRRKSP
jgi:hypothetical protein